MHSASWRDNRALNQTRNELEHARLVKSVLNQTESLPCVGKISVSITVLHSVCCGLEEVGPGITEG